MTGWNVDTLKEHIDSILAEHQHAHDQQHTANERALDAAFAAQKSAMQTAFDSRERATDAAFAAQKSAVEAALAAAKEAVQKAETAANSKFDSVNEFRGQLADYQRTLMPRAEVAVMMGAMQEKLDALTHRMDRNDGRSGGLNAGWGYLVGAVGLAAAVIGIVLALLR